MSPPAASSGTPAGPLAGLRVVELAGIGPGPLAATLLTDLGADVLRVARAGAALPGGLDGLGGGRPEILADLKHPAVVAALRAVVGRADVLLEGFRPGTMERLGLGPDDCLAANPRLVYARMTGWGQQGPLAPTAGHDITYLALTGGLHAIGEPGGKPVVPLNLVADFGGGTMFCVAGILAALHARSRTGEGQVVDAAMVDGAAYLLTMAHRSLAAGAWVEQRGANLLDGGAPFYDTYRCADGRHVAVGALEPQFFAALVRGLDLVDVPPQHDRAQWPALRAMLAAAFLRRTRDEWAAVFAGTDACVAPVLTLTEARTHPHAVARRAYVDGEPAPAPRFSQTPAHRPGVADAAAAAREMMTDWGVAAATLDTLTEGAP